MLLKGRPDTARLFGLKDHAIAFGRNIANKAMYAYNTGRYAAHTIDYGVSLLKRLHKNLAPALANSSPEAAQMAKKAFSTYDALKGAVQAADSAGRQAAGAFY
jgi:hypothetical protein